MSKAVVGAASPAVFLDRDGVIVVPEFRDGRSFAPRDLYHFRFYPEALFQLGRLKQAGYLLIVVTNQPDVGNGIVSQDVVEKMHDLVLSNLPVDAVKVCFHRQTDACQCRKPAPGMLVEAADEFAIDLSRSFMVGDRASDIEAGERAGCATAFIDLGYTERAPQAMTYRVHNLKGAVDCILSGRV